MARQHSLKNRLRQIKRWVVSPELRGEKARTEADIGEILEEQARKVRQLRDNGSKMNHHRNAWWRWVASGQCTKVQQMQIEGAVNAEHPALLASDAETYYRLLLERAGVPLS